MKVKLSWFSFLPAFVLITLIKVLELAGVTQLFEAISASYMSVIVVVISFFVNLIFSLLDRKTSPVYIMKRNTSIGVFAMLTAACVASKSFLSIINSTFDLLNLATAVFGIISAIFFVVLALAHIQGKNYMPRIGALFLSIPVWLCLTLIKSFLENRTVSAVDIDPVYNFSLIFAMILFLNVPMIVSVVEGKNAVKSCFVYGLPMTLLGYLSGINAIESIVKTGLDYSENIVSFAFLFMGIYILLFNYELTKNMKSVDEQEVEFDADEIVDYSEFYGMTKEEVVVSETDYDGDYFYGYEYGGNTEAEEDFVTAKDDAYENHDYDYGEVVLDDVLVKAEEDPAEKDESQGAIFISKDAAEVFEHNILAPDEETQVVEAEEAQEETPVENDTINKVDRLLAEIGSIDEI